MLGLMHIPFLPYNFLLFIKAMKNITATKKTAAPILPPIAAVVKLSELTEVSEKENKAKYKKATCFRGITNTFRKRHKYILFKIYHKQNLWMQSKLLTDVEYTDQRKLNK